MWLEGCHDGQVYIYTDKSRGQIDSDTRVPTDCFLDAVSEMEASPDVGIMQFASGVMNVTDS